MTTAEFVALEKSLLSILPGFAIKKDLMFVSPLEGLLRGISFEGSSFDKTSFYANFFMMPLCVPTNHLYFNFGDRVRNRSGGDRWSKEMPGLLEELSAALKTQASPVLSHTRSLLDFAKYARSCYSTNPHTPKAVGLALARAGHIDEAIEVIDGLLSQLDLSVAWQQEIAELCRTLKEKVVAGPEPAQQQLEAWETETLRNLGLEDFR